MKERAIQSLERKVTALVGEYRRRSAAEPASPDTLATYWKLRDAVRSMRRLRGPGPA